MWSPAVNGYTFYPNSSSNFPPIFRKTSGAVWSTTTQYYAAFSEAAPFVAPCQVWANDHTTLQCYPPYQMLPSTCITVELTTDPTDVATPLATWNCGLNNNVGPSSGITVSADKDYGTITPTSKVTWTLAADQTCLQNCAFNPSIWHVCLFSFYDSYYQTLSPGVEGLGVTNATIINGTTAVCNTPNFSPPVDFYRWGLPMPFPMSLLAVDSSIDFGSFYTFLNQVATSYSPTSYECQNPQALTEFFNLTVVFPSALPAMTSDPNTGLALTYSALVSYLSPNMANFTVLCPSYNKTLYLDLEGSSYSTLRTWIFWRGSVDVYYAAGSDTTDGERVALSAVLVFLITLASLAG